MKRKPTPESERIAHLMVWLILTVLLYLLLNPEPFREAILP